MELGSTSKLQAIWRAGNKEDMVELEFTYDLVNTTRRLEKQNISVSLKGKEKHDYRLTADNPSFKISIPLTKDHFGMEGTIIADFKKKNVYFDGALSVDQLKCPPPTPPSTMVLFNFY